MVKIRISLEIGSKFGVTLAERPTVPKAEVASYRQSMYRMSGFRELITPASINTSKMAMKVRLKALYTAGVEKRWRSTTTSSLPRMVQITVNSSTVKVVVLMPPPVEPGQAPINISSTESTFVNSYWAAMSTEAKPAVRVLVDWKKAQFSFSRIFSPSMVLPNSNRKKPRVPKRSRTMVTRRQI